MDHVREKLSRCFLLVFPQLPAEQIPSASVETVAGWDSVAQINLLTVVGEEFNIEIDFEDFEGATSFTAIEQRLQQLVTRP